MRVLHVYNSHRNGGGSDRAWAETIRVSIEAGIEVGVFARDSRSLGDGPGGKVRAFASGIYAPDAVASFSRLLSEFQPDIVHTHELYPLISPWILRRCREAGVLVVHSCYDYRLTCPVATHYIRGELCDRCRGGKEYWATLKNCRGSLPESLAFSLRSAVARKAGLFERNVDHYIVASDHARCWLVSELGIDAERVSANPPAVDAPATATDPRRGGYIAYAGRFVEEKGVELLIEAARRADLPVRLAGNETSHPAIRPGDPVDCVLTPTRDDLNAFYRNARMLVVPSRWREVFGLVAAEAMGHGVPVVAARTGGLPEVVVDQETGLLFEPNDVDGLVDRVRRLWADDDLCLRLGAAGRARVQTEYSPAAHARRLLEIYARAQASRAVTSSPPP
jgi:glycosyltransferase involved in cell wall biosynthesis